MTIDRRAVWSRCHLSLEVVHCSAATIDGNVEVAGLNVLGNVGAAGNSLVKTGQGGKLAQGRSIEANVDVNQLKKHIVDPGNARTCNKVLGLASGGVEKKLIELPKELHQISTHILCLFAIKGRPCSINKLDVFRAEISAGLSGHVDEVLFLLGASLESMSPSQVPQDGLQP